jgi:hypothetical protein
MLRQNLIRAEDGACLAPCCKGGALRCVRTVSRPYLFWRLGLAFARKADPQVIVDKQKWKEAIEGSELSRELAKQGSGECSRNVVVVGS